MSDWTDERIARLKHLHTEGHSMSQIAADLGGVTRNAVIGKLHRLGIQRPKRKRPLPQKQIGNWIGGGTTRKKVSRVVDMGSHVQLMEVEADIDLQPPPADDLSIPTSQRKSLLDLENHHCRWPVGTPSEPGFFFCGDPTADLTAGRPYCAAHSRRAYSALRTERSREQAAERDHSWKDRQRRYAA